MQKFNSRLFFALALAISAVVFAISLSQSRIYKTELDVLILPRNEKTAQSLNQTVESIKQIPLSLSFYNKLLEANSDIEDGAQGLPDYKRKEYWNEKIQTQRIGESGVIQINVLDQNQWQSEITAFQLKNDLFFVISKYYNIKTDLEPRLIDGPITSNIIFKNIWLALVKSLGLGIVAGFLGTILITLIVEFIFRKKEAFLNSQISFKKDVSASDDLSADTKRDVEYDFFDKKKSAAEKALEEIQAEENVFENQEETEEKSQKDLGLSDEPVETISKDKKASAPGNLPFAEEELPEIFNGNGTNANKAAVLGNEEKISYKEATPEEVQARIAKLLKGTGKAGKSEKLSDSQADNEAIKAKLNGLLG